MKYLTDDIKIDIRAHLFLYPEKYINSGRKLTEWQRELLKINLTVKNFIKDNRDINFYEI